jgi:outer membrane protein insertion porin family
MIKVLLTTFLLLFPIFSWGQSFKIKIVNVACDETSVCKRFEDKLSSLKNVDLNPRKLREKIRPFLFDLSIATFSYQVIKTDIGTVLKVKTTSRKIINSISFEMNPRSIDLGGLKNLLPYYEGEYHNPDLDAEAEAKVSKFLLEAGVANPKISIETPVKDGIVNIKFTINFERTLEIKKVKIKYDGKGNIAHIKNALNDLKNTTYNKKEINILMGDISKNLFETGYFFSELKLAPIKYLDGGEGLELEFILNLDVRVNVSFWGNKIFDRKRLMNLIKNYIRNQGLRLDGEDIIIAIEELYKEKGYYNNEVSFYIRSGKTKSGEIVDTYFFNIKEGKKIKITALNFQGNRLIADDTLIDLYEDKGTTLASSYFLDENFLEEFKKIMRAKYLEQGFVASSISKPNIEINEKTNTATVIYRIKESLICDLMRINYLRPIKDDLKLEIAKRLHNKKGKPFNILKLEDEIKSIIEVAQENGYFFAKILNKEDRS